MSERSIFLSALDISEPAERSAYLAQACGNDAQLRRHIEELVAAEAKLGGFLARPHVEVERTDDFAPVVERPGTQIGPYKLREQIGEGGFGVVYVAEQEKPVRRKVALKIIKPGMDTKDVIARFEAERQALALMDHPNVARVLDAGATGSGRPYFVMELVHGVPITEYCDKNKVPTRERLLLFSDVCRAVQHAHQKGIIHRDLKPSNIMVTLHDGKPVAKVIDFGVSKALSQQLTEKSIYTAYGQMIGTPSYMSPEQAEMSGLGIDTRSDIYSLGVLLYELLTGKTPLDARRLREGGYAEMLRMIRDEEPPCPSLKISTLGDEATSIAQHRHTDPHQLRRSLRGELDWIVMKCLEKDRSRRYETAIGLARDVERYLQDEPVEACPPSAAYRLRKFAGKHRASLAVASAFVGLLLVGVVVSSWQWNVALQAASAARQAKDSERKERERAETSAKAATAAEQSAIVEKNNALAAREELRHTLYASEMNLVQAAWDGRQYRRVAQLLDQQRPAAGQPDLRGFEWHYCQRRLQHGRLQSVEVPQLATRNYFRTPALCFSRGATRMAAVLDYPGTSGTSQGFGLLAIFDPATGRERITPVDPFANWQAPRFPSLDRLVSMSNDGKRLAVALGDAGGNRREADQGLDRISIRSGESGEEIRNLESPGFIAQIALSPNGSRLAVGYYDTLESRRQVGIGILDTMTGELVQTLPMLPRGPSGILWSPDGARLLRQQFIAAKGQDKSRDYSLVFQIVDATSGAEVWRREISAANSELRAWSWTPDGKRLVVAKAADGIAKANVQFWDSDTGETVAILDREFESPVHSSTIDFSPDGRLLAVASGANEVYVWELPQVWPDAGAVPLHIAAPHLTLYVPGEEIRGLAFSADSQRLYCAAGSTIIAWDANARDSLGLGPEASPGMFSTYSARLVGFSPDATQVVFNRSRSGTREFCVWDLVRDQEVSSLKTDANFAPVFSADGRRMAQIHRPSSAQEAPQIRIHDVSSGQELQRIEADQLNAANPAGFFTHTFFRPDGRHLAAIIHPSPLVRSPGPKRLAAWDLELQKVVFSTDLQDNASILMGYSPDGKSLVLARLPPDKRDGAVVFHDAATGDRQREIPIPGGFVPLRIDFARQAIVASVRLFDLRPGFSRADVVLLDLATGQERLRLRGHDGFDCHAISADGRRMALGKKSRSVRGDSEVSLWSLESGRLLLALKRPGWVESLAFSPDGNRLVAAIAQSPFTTSKPFYIWDATPLPEAAAQ